MSAPAGAINAYLGLQHDQFSRGIRQAEKEALGFTRSLQVQAATYGQSAREAKLYELQLRGASAATIAQARAIEQHVAMMERERSAQSQRQSADADGDAFIESLRQQIATLGMTSREIKLYELAQRGALKGTLEAAAALEKDLAFLERKRAATQAAAAAEQQLKQESEQLVASLRLQAETFGMSARQAQIYALEQKGASAATIAQARSIDGQLTSLEQQRAKEQAAAAAAKQLTHDSQQLVNSLRMEAATFGMSSRQARIYEMQMRGASAATLADARALDRHIAALERDRAAQQRSISARREFLGAAGFGRLGMLLEGGPAAMGVIAGGAIAATAAVVGLGVAGSAVAMKLAADFEQVQVAFRVIIGNAQMADDVLLQIRQFANATPFEFGELAGGAKQLAAYGIEARQLVPTLRMLGDLSAGLNIPIGELADLYGRNRAQQRLYTRDLNEFMGRGIPLLEEFAKMFGKTTPEIRAMVEDGQIYFSDLQQALINLTEEGGRFAGLTEEQSKTVLGRWSTMKDAALESMRTIGETLNEGLDTASFLQDVGTYFEMIADGARIAQPAISNFFKEFREGRGWLAAIAPAISKLLAKFHDEAEEYREFQEKQKKSQDEEKVKPDAKADLEAQQRDAERAKTAKEEDERLAKDGQRVHEENRTAQEKYADELQRLTTLLEAEKISMEDYNRARDKAKKEFEESTPEWKARQEAEKKARQEQEALAREGRSLIEHMRTPQEKFDALVADYERLLAAGAIDQTTYDRAVAAAEKDLAGGGQAEQRFAGAAEIGSTEWYSALIRGNGNPLEKEHLQVDKETLKETKKIVGEMEKFSARPVVVELL